MKKTIFLALAMVIFSGCGKADSAECPDIEYQQVRDVGIALKMRARDDISIHNIIINRGNCLYTLDVFSVFSGFNRNGVDRIQIGGNPLTSDYIESIKEEYREEAYKPISYERSVELRKQLLEKLKTMKIPEEKDYQMLKLIIR